MSKQEDQQTFTAEGPLAVGPATTYPSAADYLHDILSEISEQTEILRDLRNTVQVEIAAGHAEILRDIRAALDKRFLR